MKEEGGSVNIVVISILIGVVILIVAILGFSGKEKVSLPLKFEEFTDSENKLQSLYLCYNSNL